MRLIDADALIQKANYEADGMAEPFKSQIGVLVEWLVDKMPTIEPKQGKWIEDIEQNHIEKCWHCSECGYKAWGKYEKTDFCGGCGAKMDGSEEE